MRNKKKLVLLSMPLLALLLYAIISGGGCEEEKEVYVPVPVYPDQFTPQTTEWEKSAHADKTAEAFRHWDEDGEISTSCAQCHAHQGFLDFLGADGTAAGTVENPVLVGPGHDSNIIVCETCHNDQAVALDSVTFPSGKTVAVSNPSVRCMQCHQGRESGADVDADIQTAMDCGSIVGEDDLSTGDGKLTFLNIHYLPAAATLYGNDAAGGYQYAGKSYNKKFDHSPPYQSCTDCHDPHNLEIKVDTCGTCHVGVSTEADFFNIRMSGSIGDYDGDGNVTEGIKSEVDTLRMFLLSTMKTYATSKGTHLAYDAHAYPYFFIDTNGNGMADPEEANYGNQYTPWTARLLKAAFNYQYATKDPGAYAHNPKYMIQLIYDSVEDLDNTAVATMNREDGVHFGVSSEAFRHWDEASYNHGPNEIPGECSRCHSDEGAKFFMDFATDMNVFAKTSDGFSCEVCHVGGDYATTAARRIVSTVTFPSGSVIIGDPEILDDSFLCLSCHQGRESIADIDAQIAASDFEFINVHYVPAGAVLYGNQALVGYMYGNNTYDGKWEHGTPTSSQCTECHLGDHSFRAQLVGSCLFCHAEATIGNLSTIRLNRLIDYDNDGNNTEPLADELMTIGNALYVEIRAYANSLGNNIVYDELTYPYWFWDENNDNIKQDTETTSYSNWDGALMKAAHNYQIWVKEPGAWAHNTNFTVQILIDSMEDLRATSAAHFNRP